MSLDKLMRRRRLQVTAASQIEKMHTKSVIHMTYIHAIINYDAIQPLYKPIAVSLNYMALH